MLDIEKITFLLDLLNTCIKLSFVMPSKHFSQIVKIFHFCTNFLSNKFYQKKLSFQIKLLTLVLPAHLQSMVCVFLLQEQLFFVFKRKITYLLLLRSQYKKLSLSSTIYIGSTQASTAYMQSNIIPKHTRVTF